jgi:hypothetical protein
MDVEQPARREVGLYEAPVKLGMALYENASYSHSGQPGRMTSAHGEENLFG